MINELIQQLHGVNLSDDEECMLAWGSRTIALYVWRVDPQAVRRWLVEEYPAIASKAQGTGADIYFCEEAGVRSDHHSGTTWSAVGEATVIEKTGNRFGLNLISAISAEGSMRYMEVNGHMNAGRFVESLERLIKNRDRPVYLIVDGHPSHKAKKVLEFVN